MTTFPALIPSTRSYSPGEFPHTAHPLLSGSEIRVRHSNTVIGVRLRLTFTAITSADLLAVQNHYRDRQGGFLPFAIPAELLSGVTTPADFTPAGHQWRYAARPSVTDVPIPGTTPTNRHDLVLELESVPPENTIVSGARLRAQVALQAGSAQRGAFFDVFASVVGGAAGYLLEANLYATVELIRGEAGVIGGEVAITAEASVAVGAASAGAIDPDFASVVLLLPMDGTNGSTTFIDSSSNAHTITAIGNSQISTVQKKWGTGSGLFDGSGDFLTVPDDPVFDFESGAFTLEAWVYPTSAASEMCVLGKRANAGIVPPFWFGLLPQSGTQRVYFNGRTSEATGPDWSINPSFTTGGTAIALNTWNHIAVVRNGTTFTTYLNGIESQAFTGLAASMVVNTSAVSIGASSVNGDNAFAGNLDDIRVTKGVARYTSNFTPPTAPFPDS